MVVTYLCEIQNNIFWSKWMFPTAPQKESVIFEKESCEIQIQFKEVTLLTDMQMSNQFGLRKRVTWVYEIQNDTYSIMS
jgi:hypothetical protein